MELGKRRLAERIDAFFTSDLARAVAEQARVPPLVLESPVTSLAELAALIDDAALLLGNDTGPRQIAVA